MLAPRGRHEGRALVPGILAPAQRGIEGGLGVEAPSIQRGQLGPQVVQRPTVLAPNGQRNVVARLLAPAPLVESDPTPSRPGGGCVVFFPREALCP